MTTLERNRGDSNVAMWGGYGGMRRGRQSHGEVGAEEGRGSERRRDHGRGERRRRRNGEEALVRGGGEEGETCWGFYGARATLPSRSWTSDRHLTAFKNHG